MGGLYGCIKKKKSILALLIGSALLTLALLFAGCKQTGSGGESQGGNGGGTPTPPTPPVTKKHTLTFGVEGGKDGTLKAKADGTPETEASPISIEEGKEVTFTATPNAGYSVKGWTLDGNAVNGTNTTYTYTVLAKPATITVSFELAPVKGAAVLILSPDKRTIKVEARTADSSAIKVEGCTETTLANGVKTELHANGATVTIIGKITFLDCRSNKLTELNVQG